jgi:hypothetical protein
MISVGRRSLRRLLGEDGHIRDRRLDLPDRDAALLPEAEGPELGDHDTRVLAGDVAEDHVSARLERCAL